MIHHIGQKLLAPIFIAQIFRPKTGMNPAAWHPRRLPAAKARSPNLGQNFAGP